METRKNSLTIQEYLQETHRDAVFAKKSNHVEENSYFRKDRTGTTSRKVDKVFFYANNTRKEGWVVDSGASNHMVNDIYILNVAETLDTKICTAKESIIMETKAVEEVVTENCIFKNVILVPELTKNILFINAITEKDGEIKFTKDKVQILLDNTKVLEGSQR